MVCGLHAKLAQTRLPETPIGAALFAWLVHRATRIVPSVAASNDTRHLELHVIARTVLTAIANQCNVNLEDVLKANFEKKTNRDNNRHIDNPKLK
jgi:hypothetical protein